MSTRWALPPVISTGVVKISEMGDKPSCPRQRFTLADNPPPSPGDELTLTAAVAPPSPVRMNLATRNCPAATSCQPAGTCQFGLPSLETGPVAGEALAPV